VTTTRISPNEIYAEKARRSFRAYCEFVHGAPDTNNVLEPLELPPHFVYFEATLTTQEPAEKATATSAPPEFWKSRTRRMYIEWSIGKYPERARLLIMNTAAQATKQVMSVAETIERNPRYAMVFPHVVPDDNKQWNQSTLYIRRANAARPDATLFGTGVLGPIQGGHFEEIYLDDVTDPQDVYSEKTMQQQREWIKGLLLDRLIRDPQGHPVGLLDAVFTRWGDNDLWETFTAPMNPDSDEGGLGMRQVVLPAVNDDEPYPWGRVLWPQAFPETRLDQLRSEKGISLYTMTFLCDPSATGGIVFARHQWHRYDFRQPPEFARKIHSWDTAGGTSASAAFSVMQEWSEGPQGWYLTFAWRGRLRYGLLLPKVYELHDWAAPSITLIENKSTGNSLVQDIEANPGRMPGLRAINPQTDGGKLERAEAATVYLERGACWIPAEQASAPWLDEFLTELTNFPNGRFADHVDAFSQAMTWIERNGGRGRMGRRRRGWMMPDDQESNAMKTPSRGLQVM